VPIYNQRWFVVLVEVFYLIVLFVLALIYFTDPRKSIPFTPFTIPDTLGALPIGVPWFGALGAVVISLSGAFDHRSDWDPSWNLWHFTRPFIGVSLAIISWLIFEAGILAVGSNPTPTGSPPATATSPKNLLYFLIAFIVGYREEIFRDLIKKVADVILTPNTPSSSGGAVPVISAVNPPAGPAPGGTSVTIDGSGFTGATSVKFGTALATNVNVISDKQISAVSPAGTAGSRVQITVTTKAGNATSGGFTYQ
jgi:hypothetical protein